MTVIGEDCAIVTISKGMVHLDFSWNPCAGCCEESDDIVQLEAYSSSGWHEPQDNPRLAEDFWGVWTDWNGKMCGGICLHDDHTYADMRKMQDSHRKVEPKGIKDLEDGVYTVLA